MAKITEIWKDIPNTEIYQASNLGRIRSKERMQAHANVHGPHLRKMPNRIRVQYLDKGGYLNVCLQINGRPFTKLSHRLIAITFIPNPENKRCVNHKNGKRSDNRVENLEWVTDSENAIHAINVLHRKIATGERVWSSKLTTMDIIIIREAYRLTHPIKLIAKYYGVSYNSIHRIVHGECWSHVKNSL